MVLRLECAAESPEGLVNTQITDPLSRVSDLVYLGLSLSICISNEFPVEADAAVQGTTRWEPSVYITLWKKLNISVN